jgi:hypothetical protein
MHRVQLDLILSGREEITEVTSKRAVSSAAGVALRKVTAIRGDCFDAGGHCFRPFGPCGDAA